MERSLVIPADVDGTTILVEVVSRGGEQEIVNVGLPSFAGVGKAISKVAKEMATAIEAVKPTKATLEFGCEFAVEAGHLTTLIVSGSGSASLKVTLEWKAS